MGAIANGDLAAAELAAAATRGPTVRVGAATTILNRPSADLPAAACARAPLAAALRGVQRALTGSGRRVHSAT